MIALMDELNIRHAHFFWPIARGVDGYLARDRTKASVNTLTLADTSAKILDESTWRERIELVSREGLLALAMVGETDPVTPVFES